MKNKEAIELNVLEVETPYHVPVMLNEVIEGLQIKPNGVYVDCTFGGGGHSRAILQKLNSVGKLIVFDQDADAKKNIITNDERIEFVPQNFKHIQRFLRLLKIEKVDGVLADLGVSSHQFDEAERGFSIRFNADLDMRMDQRQTITAASILNTFSEIQLHKMFEKYGEVTNAKTLAKKIIEQRNIKTFQTIEDLKKAIQFIVKGNPQKYFAQVFQAIRIEVNDELNALNEMLHQLPKILNINGRVVIITFHSIEDRMVKNYLKFGSLNEMEKDEIYGIRIKNPFTIITKKPILASDIELKNNKRSRSAKLRIAELSNY